jgi:hypothetical protein
MYPHDFLCGPLTSFLDRLCLNCSHKQISGRKVCLRPGKRWAKRSHFDGSRSPTDVVFDREGLSRVQTQGCSRGQIFMSPISDRDSLSWIILDLVLSPCRVDFLQERKFTILLIISRGCSVCKHLRHHKVAEIVESGIMAGSW